MKKKLLGILVCTLLIATAVLPVSGDIDLNKSYQDINKVVNEENSLEYPQDFEIYATSGGYAPWVDIFRLEINTNGEVIYSIVYPEDKHEGSGEWTKISEFVLTENEMNQIWDAVETNDFFSLDSYYSGSALDGTFAYVKITADGVTHSVKTENIPVAQLDNIVKTINSFTPGDYDLFYNDILFNSRPDKPSTPSGSTSGKPGMEYTYSTMTTDPNGDDIYYLFDWDDGANSGWVGPYDPGDTGSAKHTWSSEGSYEIKVKAKDDPNGDGDLSDGKESFWSDPLPISMPKNKQTANLLLLQFFQKFMSQFPLLKYLFYENYLYETYNPAPQATSKILDHERGIFEVTFRTLDHESGVLLLDDNSGTYVTIDGCDITVEIRIQISGEGATDDLAEEIEEDIEDVWNDDWKIKCKEDCERHEPGCPVTFDANVSKLGENQAADPGAHQIEVEDDPTGEGISSVDLPLPTPNGGTAGSGTWDNDEPDHTWAHEAGHLMGLNDCYKVISENPYITQPKPNCRGNIMGTLDGSPSQDNVSQIVADGGVECPCECCPEENDTEEPDVDIESPQNGSSVTSPINVTGSASDYGGSGVAELDYKLEWDGGSHDGYSIYIDPPVEETGFELGPLYLEDYLDPEDEWLKITIYAIDAAGNTGSDSVTVTWEEEEDTTPPVTDKNIEEQYEILPFTEIILEATDDMSGVHYIHYDIWWDSDGDMEIDTQMADENIPGDIAIFTTADYGILNGLIQLKYYAEDNAQNQEEPHQQYHFVIG